MNEMVPSDYQMSIALLHFVIASARLLKDVLYLLHLAVFRYLYYPEQSA
jgi:hypothetical protein